MKQLYFVFFLFTSVLSAQETIPSSGGDATGSGGSSSYTVGQVVYTTNFDSSGSVAQGVQQSNKNETLSAQEFTDLLSHVNPFPNPASDHIVLALGASNLLDLNYVLYDLTGKSLLRGALQQERTTIPMNDLASGLYFLKVKQNHNELKTFKIIKK